MKVLHICSAYSKQNLYSELLIHLNEKNVSQLMYVPVRSKNEIGKNDISQIIGLQVQYSHVLRTIDRFFFKNKINRVYSDLLKRNNPQEFNITHAHFLFSDGGVALQLYKEFNIPYIVSVRNTDVNYFFKYYKHLKRYGNEILKNAEKIIFLTPSYRDIVASKYVYPSLRNSFESKCTIIPNGLNDSWFSNDQSKLKKRTSELLKLLYVGDFTPNKNVESIIDSAIKLHNEGIKVSLTLVGGGGRRNERTMEKINSTSDIPITFLGRITVKEKLKEIYQEHDIFAMPSFRETFGMVYIEAISQGLPIIYTKNQGVDGYFREDKKPGLAVKADDTEEIVNAVKEIWKNLETFSTQALDVAEQFRWKLIVDRIFEIYKSKTYES